MMSLEALCPLGCGLIVRTDPAAKNSPRRRMNNHLMSRHPGLSSRDRSILSDGIEWAMVVG